MARSRLRPFKGLSSTLLYACQPCSGRIELEGKTGTKWNAAWEWLETKETVLEGYLRQCLILHFIAYISDIVVVIELFTGVSLAHWIEQGNLLVLEL